MFAILTFLGVRPYALAAPSNVSSLMFCWHCSLFIIKDVFSPFIDLWFLTPHILYVASIVHVILDLFCIYLFFFSPFFVSLFKVLLSLFHPLIYFIHLFAGIMPFVCQALLTNFTLFCPFHLCLSI